MPRLFSDPFTLGSITFNTDTEDADGATWYCDTLEGWEDSPDLDSPGSNNGYTDGVRYSDRFPVHPRAVEMSGVIVTATREAALVAWRKLQSQLRNGLDVVATRYGPFNEEMKVRRISDLRKSKDLGHSFRFVTTLEAPWPYKTSLNTKSAIVSPFTGSEFLREYPRTYTMTYDKIDDEGAGGGATAALLVNDGNATAYPIIRIRGPLDANAWYVINETSGEVLGLSINMVAGQVLVVDTLEQSAHIGTTAVDYYITGDWLSIPPEAASVFKLITGDPNASAQLTIEMKDTWS